MDAKALKALEASIRHWKRVRNDSGCSAIPDDDHCPLCALYLDADCCGCPVKKRTGEETCDGSPYKAAWDAWNLKRVALGAFEAASQTFQIAADAEIALLESLRPKKRAKKKAAKK